jgi:aryl-alcohol dehydrogenase-like predicted oxidoreductase
MQVINLGEGGPAVSALGLGCNNFGHNKFGEFADYKRCERIVHAALDLGYTFFDTADSYAMGKSEEYLGRALGSRQRDQVLVSTKFGAQHDMPGAPDVPKGSAEWVRWAIEGSLRRLGTDRIDLYQMHMPDPVTPIAETLGALGALVTEGKVRYVGVGGFSAEQLEIAVKVATTGGLPVPISHMTHYSLLDRTCEQDVIPACVRLGIRVHTWAVIESGLLAGKFMRIGHRPEGARLSSRVPHVQDEVWDALEQIEAFAAAKGISLLELAIGGIAAMAGVGVVIVGASTPEQAAANARARDWIPSDAEVAEIHALPWAAPRIATDTEYRALLKELDR